MVSDTNTDVIAATKEKPPGRKVILSIEDLHVWFELRLFGFGHAGSVKAVDGVTFDVHEGETIAVVGLLQGFNRRHDSRCGAGHEGWPQSGKRMTDILSLELVRASFRLVLVADSFRQF